MNINLYSNDGFGGSLTTYGAAKIIRRMIPEAGIVCHFTCSDQVYDALLLFKPESVDEIHRVNENWYNEQKENGERVYNLTPDLFDNNSSFFNEIGLTWRQIKQQRALDDFDWTRSKEGVCFAFSTAQENNSYPFANKLIKEVCELLPKVNFYYPVVKTWADKTLEDNIDESIKAIPNLSIYEPKDLGKDLETLRNNCRYYIGIDNGVMNFAYHCNAERWLIDSRYNNPAFSVRWRQDIADCIDINTSPRKIAEAFTLQYKNPFLSGLPKFMLLQENVLDWIGVKPYN